MDKEKVKKALDHFENDEFVDAKEILKKEIAAHRDAKLKDKLELQNDITPAPEAKKDADGEGDDNDKE